MSIVHIPFYPSDWLAGTLGLSDAEKGVYITLIARMYEMAGPIERNDDRLFRICGSKSKASFVKALEYLISEGKILDTKNGLFNEKASKVIEQTIEKSSKAKAAAQSRWDRNPNKNNGSNDANASAEHMPQQCQPEPEPELKKEDTNVSLQVSPAGDVSEAVRIYNDASARTGWPSVQKLTPARSKALRGRINDAGGMDGWRVAVEKAEQSDFLCGRTPNPWTGCSFDWLAKSANFTKLMEGNYDNRTDRTNAQSSGNRPDETLERIARLARLR